jgi:GT2 family glycosyltransferase
MPNISIDQSGNCVPGYAIRTPTVSVIIPTKNRVDHLALAVETLFRQTILPSELAIVDQSQSDDSRIKVESMYKALSDDQRLGLRLHYIHDPLISGLAAARNAALDRNSCDVLLFLDDDVELEEDFLEELLQTYAAYPSVVGVSGVVTNYSAPPLALRLWKRIFMLGPFRDDRERFYWKAAATSDADVRRVTRLGGGLMSFRATAIGDVRFDERLRGVSDGEDVDFCMHLGPGAELLMNSRARLVHNASPTGRTADHWLRRYLRGQTYLYRRNWNSGLTSRLCFLWFMTGATLIASLSSAGRLSLRPLQALVLGYQDGVAAAAGQ